MLGFLKKNDEAIGDYLPDDMTFRINARAKRITLRVKNDDPNYRFILTVPKRFSTSLIEEFLERHEAWITKHRVTQKPFNYFKDQTIFKLLDEEITINYGGNTPRRATCLKDNILTVYGDEVLIGKRVIRFLKQQAKTIFTDKAAYFADKANCDFSKIRVTDTKSCWGSCSHDGVISLSWRLLLAPEYVCDYVVAHEISHRLHMDHSSQFWTTCEGLYPQTKQAKQWLKKYGVDLNLWQA